MIRFAVPNSLDDCVRRLETSQQVGVSLAPYYRVSFMNSTETSVGFRFEWWIGSLRIGYAQGALSRDGDTSTKVQGIAILNTAIQFGIFLVIALGLFLAWSRFPDSSNSFLIFAVAFIVVGQGVPMLVRGRIGAALQRVLTQA